MSITEGLTFGFGNRRLPVILQTEAAECALACLAMISGFHGNRTDLATLRNQHSISLKGTTLADLIRIADSLHLGTRPLKLDLREVHRLQLPCIVHWNFDHYVVVKSVRDRIIVHDPAFGHRKLTAREFSAGFTGVALELWPNPGFKRKTEARRVAVAQLLGRVTGLWRSFGQVLILAGALEIFALVSPFFMQWVIDDSIVSGDRDLLTTLALGFGLLTIVKVLIGAIRSWVLMHMGTLLNVQWRANVFAHLLRLPATYYLKRHLGDINSRFASIDQIQTTLTTSFVEAILDGVMSIVTLVMMFIYSRVLGLIAAVTMVLYALCRWIWYGALRSATHSQIVFAARQQSHFLESIRGIRTIKLFRHERNRCSSWLSILVDQINAGLRNQKLQIIYSSINALLIGIETILVVWFGAKMVLTADFSVGALIAFKSYDDQFLTRTSGLIDKLLQFQMLRLYGERLADIVLSEPESAGALEHQPEDGAGGSISVANLRFRYAEHEPWVLNGVSFSVAAGESVAIVGPSGCGKSTLLHVLLGVFPPNGGDIAVGARSLEQLGPQGLRAMVASVLQDDTLFAGSIRENISFFDPQADLGWIEHCARIAAVHEEILAMPMGYNSLVGDMGTVLSGGQKQRVLLARALYRRPRILILDEATSHLDVNKEKQVIAGMDSLKITRIMVTHRPETIAAATRVLVLESGRIRALRPDEPPAKSSPVEQIVTHQPGRSRLEAPSFMRIS